MRIVVTEDGDDEDEAWLQEAEDVLHRYEARARAWLAEAFARVWSGQMTSGDKVPKGGAWMVSCPTCLAEPDQRCHNEDGIPLRFSYHATRLSRYYRGRDRRADNDRPQGKAW